MRHEPQLCPLQIMYRIVVPHEDIPEQEIGLILSNSEAKETQGATWVGLGFDDIYGRGDFKVVVFQLEKDGGVQWGVTVNDVKALFAFVGLVPEDLWYDLRTIFLI